MAFKLSKFTLHVNIELLKKFQYVAKYNDCSANQELITLIKKHVEKFEKQNGKIKDFRF